MVESRRFSVRLALGDGAVADVLLWKNRKASAALLIGSTTLWFLFERAGYNLLSFIANVLLLLVSILFFWAKSASSLNRPLPPIPDLTISDEALTKAAEATRVYINRVFSIGHDIAINGMFSTFIRAAFGLWTISLIGSFFNFLTLIYMGILLSLSVPFVYDKYQDMIDEKLIVALNGYRTLYRKIDETVLRKILMLGNKKKKTQ